MRSCIVRFVLAGVGLFGSGHTYCDKMRTSEVMWPEACARERILSRLPTLEPREEEGSGAFVFAELVVGIADAGGCALSVAAGVDSVLLAKLCECPMWVTVRSDMGAREGVCV